MTKGTECRAVVAREVDEGTGDGGTWTKDATVHEERGTGDKDEPGVSGVRGQGNEGRRWEVRGSGRGVDGRGTRGRWTDRTR